MPSQIIVNLLEGNGRLFLELYFRNIKNKDDNLDMIRCSTQNTVILFVLGNCEEKTTCNFVMGERLD